VLAVVRDELGRHRLQLAAEEQVEEERRHEVVAMMAERDLGRAKLACHAIQDAAAQTRAQRAHGGALGHQPFDHAVRVLLGDPEVDAAAAQVRGQHVLRKARLLLVEVDRDEGERHRRAALERQQDVEQTVAVLAPGQADHHVVAGFDHRVVGDGLAHLALEALGELVDLELRAPGIPCAQGGRVGRRCGQGRAVFHGPQF
jgi:hypothetical protein